MHINPKAFPFPAGRDDFKLLVQRHANKPLLPDKPQIPLDIGLFSDDSLQTDLIEMLIDPID